MKNIFLCIVYGLLSRQVSAQSIFMNPITGANPSASNPYITGHVFDPNISGGGIGRGSGVAPSAAADRYNASGWDSPSLDANDYFEWTLTPNSGASINFTDFVYAAQVSGTGPAAFAFRSSLDGFTTNIGSPVGNGTTIDLSAPAFQGLTAAISFRLYGWGASGMSGTFSINDFTFHGAVSPVTPQYYRSAASGDWNNPASWEFSPDNITWSNATLIPTSLERSITIQAGHSLTVSAPASLDETIINGHLQVITGGVLTISNGAGNDIDIRAGGVLQVLSADTYGNTINAGTAVIGIATGGKIEIGDGVTPIGSGYENFATSANHSWADAALFEWNNAAPFLMAGLTFFPGAGASIPEFRISAISGTPTSGSSGFTLNGILAVHTDITLAGGSAKIFRNGIRGTATLTQDATAGNSFNLAAAGALLDGNGLHIALASPLHLSASTLVPAGANVTVSGATVNNSGGMITIDGVLDITTVQVTNTSGTMAVNGTLKTAHPGGLYGTGSSIPSGAIMLNPGSTIEYNADGPQDVQGATLPSYYNVTFSGSGTKTLVSSNIPAGTITVSGAAVLDAGNNTFGGAGTGLTMTGTSRYINGGAGTKPDARGTYSLGPNTTIEFANSSATNIRLGLSPVNYAHIVVSGSNVSNASTVTGVLLQPGGSFTVKSGAVFKLENADGLSGSPAAAISSNNNPLITLENGSTIVYNGTINQQVTNEVPYHHLVFSGAGRKTAHAGILTVRGNLTSPGTGNFDPGTGTVVLDGTGTQTFAGLTYNNLLFTGGTRITVGNSTILDSLTINTATTLSISAADTITLHSDAIKTARVGRVAGAINYNTSGKFLVERYFPARKAWRFLAVPVMPAQSIKDAWQEGAVNGTDDPLPGYGTQITSNDAGWAARGFDAYSFGGPSMKTYDALGNNYQGIASTLAPFDPSKGGYMIFIRGDRGATAVSSPVTSTVLRMTGRLFTGDQPLIPVTSGQFVPVNNPYASPIDLRNLSHSYNLFYYVFDPHRSGVYGFGAWQTLSWNGSGYDVVPGGGSYPGMHNYIESGQAFMVATLGADTSLQFTENVKTAAVTGILPFVPGGMDNAALRVNIFTDDSDGGGDLADGVLALYGKDFSDGLDGMDAQKIFNTGENLAINSHLRSLAVERRGLPHPKDTLYLSLSGVTARPYLLQVIPSGWQRPGMEAFLEDTFLQVRHPVSFRDTTLVRFLVNSESGSYAPGRFRILFSAAEGPLPVTFLAAGAYRRDEDVVVEWEVGGESGISRYEVQRSGDGVHFGSISMVTAGNTLRGNTYRWTDAQPGAGTFYYRVKSVGSGGAGQYSPVLKVVMPAGSSRIIVFPNPVRGGTFMLQLLNQPKGMYHLRLLNTSGALLLKRQFRHAGGSSRLRIPGAKRLPHGSYRMVVTPPSGNEISLQVFF